MKNLRAEVRISGIYIIIGFLWILFSDKAMLLFANDSHTIQIFSTLKGWFYVSITGVLLYILIRRDAIKNINHAKELQAAKEKAEESDKLKSLFLSNLSHEIRSPMNAILGFSDLLQNPELADEKKSQYSTIINEKTTQLLQLVNNLIESARIQENTYTIFIERILFYDFINNIYRSFSSELSHFNKNNITLIHDSNKELSSVEIFSDPTKVEQIFRNLISNAIKYTKNGKIVIGFVKHENEIECYVKDEGIGIPPEKHPFLFDRFYQSNEKKDQKYGGSGLGLSICKAFTEMLGGKIWLTSEEGKGSAFCFTLPINYEIKK